MPVSCGATGGGDFLSAKWLLGPASIASQGPDCDRDGPASIAKHKPSHSVKTVLLGKGPEPWRKSLRLQLKATSTGSSGGNVPGQQENFIEMKLSMRQAGNWSHRV